MDAKDDAAPGTPLAAFADSGSFHVQEFFRETEMRRIAVGDRAPITLMVRRGQPIEGIVGSLGRAINPANVATTESPSGLVPRVQPFSDSIGLVQPVPIRIRIEKVPDGVRLISGATSSIATHPES